MRFVTWVKLKVYQISDKLVHQGLRYGVSDGTFEAKKDQPKLEIRNLEMIARSPRTALHEQKQVDQEIG